MVWLILRYSSTKRSWEFFKFWFFAIFWGGSAAQSLKNAIFWDFGCRKIGKNRNIKIPHDNFCAYTYKDHVCQFLGKSDHFPETSSNFSVKNWYILSAKNAIIIYKGFSSTAKTLPHVFIHNFWTEHFQTKYEYILKTRKIALHHIVKAKENRKMSFESRRLWKWK